LLEDGQAGDGGIDGRHMGAALSKDVGHDFSDLRRAFDEEHPNAIETWSLVPDIHCVTSLIVELSGREDGMRLVAGRSARSLPDCIARSLVGTNPAIYWALVQ
jgi:hypothetical protein